MRNVLAMPVLFFNRLLNQTKLSAGRLYRSGRRQKTTVRAMRLTAYLLVLACLQVGARGVAQINLSERKAPLKKVFNAISKQTGFSVLYDESDLQKGRSVDVFVRNATIEETLRIVFFNQPLVYSIVENTIIVKQRTTAPSEAAPAISINLDEL